MRDVELFERGLELFNANRIAEFQEFLRQMREENPPVASLLEIHHALLSHNPAIVLRKAKRMFSTFSGKPELAVRFYMRMGVAQKMIGEIGLSDSYFARAKELAEKIGDSPAVEHARVELLYNRFMKQEYDSLYKDLAGLDPSDPLFDHRHIKFIMAMILVVQGEIGKAKRLLDLLVRSDKVGEYMRISILEIRGIISRLEGNLNEAVELYEESAEGYLSLGSAYAAFPCAKALQITRLANIKPPPGALIKRCLRTANKGGWGEQAAGKEIEALLTEDEGEAALRLFEAAKGYYRVYQNIESVMAGLLASYLAWKVNHPVFMDAMRFLGPILPLYPGLKKDPIIGDFMARAEAFLRGEQRNTKRGIRAWLIGDLRVEVNGSELSVTRWGSKQAMMAFIYLLLSPRHRIPQDHLFYLLWPKKPYTSETRSLLYRVMSILRKNLSGSFLVKRGDFYQLEDVWTDLEEIEDLIRKAEGAGDPQKTKELLFLAGELAKGELLPEFPYDPYIEEYRGYYEGLKRRIARGSSKP
ncbi:MAG: hypothetical protein ABIM19_01040 [candidate division WOR-3 bacterium]